MQALVAGVIMHTTQYNATQYAARYTHTPLLISHHVSLVTEENGNMFCVALGNRLHQLWRRCMYGKKTAKYGGVPEQDTQGPLPQAVAVHV